jgi:PhoPQ-activated pathogenicity-related protein
MKKLTDAVDPMNFYDRLARIPKVAVLSSDDEFMMMDWTNIWCVREFL